MNKRVLIIRNLNVKYINNRKVINAIRGLNLDIFHGEFLGIVGESKSGKSVLLKSIINLVEKNGWISSGSIMYVPSDEEEESEKSIKKVIDIVEHHRSDLLKDTIADIRQYYSNKIKSFGKEIKLVEFLNLDKAHAIEDKYYKKHDEYVIDLWQNDTVKKRYKIAKVDSEINRWRKYIYLQKNPDEKEKYLNELVEKVDKAQKEFERIRALTLFDKLHLAKIMKMISEYQNGNKEVWNEDNIFYMKKYFMKHDNYNNIEEMFKQAVETQLAGFKLEEEDFSDLCNKWDSVKKINIINKFRAQKQTALLRGITISAIFQNPSVNLNPNMSIGSQLSEVLLKKSHTSPTEAKSYAFELLEKVGFRNPILIYKKRPSYFSLAEKQRINIAIAIANKPRVLICDDPVTMLDPISRVNILNLIYKLKKEMGFTLIVMTHDLRDVMNNADRIAIMNAGQVVEFGTTEEVITNSQHPYTWTLLASLPEVNKNKVENQLIIKDAIEIPEYYTGDHFALRNPNALKIDFIYEPPLFKLTDTHYAKTWLLDYRSPKVERPEVIKNIKTILDSKEGE